MDIETRKTYDKIFQLRPHDTNVWSIETTLCAYKKYKKNKKKFNLYYKVYVDQISYVLNLIGVNINTVPVLDFS